LVSNTQPNQAANTPLFPYQLPSSNSPYEHPQLSMGLGLPHHNLTDHDNKMGLSSGLFGQHMMFNAPLHGYQNSYGLQPFQQQIIPPPPPPPPPQHHQQHQQHQQPQPQQYQQHTQQNQHLRPTQSFFSSTFQPSSPQSYQYNQQHYGQ